MKVIKPKSHPSYVAFGGHGRVKAPKKIVPVQPRRARPPRQTWSKTTSTSVY